MKFICVQPAINYYKWQLEVMIINFLEMGIDKNDIQIILTYNQQQECDEFLKLSKYGVKLFFYQDTRLDKSYIPSVYFHGLKKHLWANPELANEQLFLHDSDIVFTKPFDLTFNQDKFYLSDTRSYINYNYLISKGEEQFLELCKIVGISPDLVKENNENSGGAQYVVHSVTGDLFDKIENDANRIYAYLCPREPLWQGKGYPIQKWTAGMWAELWNFWASGFKTEILKSMDFTWSSNPIKDISKNLIFHNAGITEAYSSSFFKGNYRDRLPYNLNLDLKDENCSKWYYEWVKKAEKQSVFI